MNEERKLLLAKLYGLDISSYEEVIDYGDDRGEDYIIEKYIDGTPIEDFSFNDTELIEIIEELLSINEILNNPLKLDYET